MTRRAATKGGEVQSARCELTLKTPLTQQRARDLDAQIAIDYVDLMQIEAQVVDAKERLKTLRGKLAEEGAIRSRGYDEGHVECLVEYVGGALVYTRLDTNEVIPDDAVPAGAQWSLPYEFRRAIEQQGFSAADDDEDEHGPDA